MVSLPASHMSLLIRGVKDFKSKPREVIISLSNNLSESTQSHQVKVIVAGCPQIFISFTQVDAQDRRSQ